MQVELSRTPEAATLAQPRTSERPGKLVQIPAALLTRILLCDTEYEYAESART